VTSWIAVLASIALVAGCGTGGDDDASGARATTATSTTAPTASTSAGEPADDVPPFPRDTARQTADDAGEWDLVLTDVRVAGHEGFDRIVLEFAGTGTPGWGVEYADEAVLEGSGDVVTLGGDSVLTVVASGTTYPGAGGGHYGGPDRLVLGPGGAVTDVHVGGTFEGYTQVFAGVEGDPAPFRVFALDAPSRLVVDVSTAARS
jgi:hypothetical protein